MKKTILLTLILAATFGLGFTFSNIISTKSNNKTKYRNSRKIITDKTIYVPLLKINV